VTGLGIAAQGCAAVLAFHFHMDALALLAIALVPVVPSA
jgi:hypothetical protein